jgi:hypothetical protein
MDQNRYNKTMKKTHRECQNNRLENEMDIQIIEFKMPDHPCRAGIAIVYINSLVINIYNKPLTTGTDDNLGTNTPPVEVSTQ